MVPGNHMEMCRFASRDDEGYKKFLVALRGYVEVIKGKKSAVERERELAALKVERERREGR